MQSRQSLIALVLRLRPALIRAARVLPSTPCSIALIGTSSGGTEAVLSSKLTSDSTLLRNREFPRSVFGSATFAPRRAVAQRFPNLVEGNGVRERQDLALLDGLMQLTLLKLSLSPRGLCERRGDP